MEFCQVIVKKEADEEKNTSLGFSVMSDTGCKVFIKEELEEDEATNSAENNAVSTETCQVFLKEEIDEEKTDVECGPMEYGCEEVPKVCR